MAGAGAGAGAPVGGREGSSQWLEEGSPQSLRAQSRQPLEEPWAPGQTVAGGFGGRWLGPSPKPPHISGPIVSAAEQAVLGPFWKGGRGDLPAGPGLPAFR